MENPTKKEEIQKVDPAQIEILDTRMSPESLKAITALRTAKVPPEHIKKHPGRSGKVFSYVSHVHATEDLHDALGMNWDWQILDTQLYPDKSATARGQLTLHWKDREEVWHVRLITEVGGFEDLTGKFPQCNIVLAACSRALLRCMFRAFLYGREFYPDDESGLTAAQAWKVLEQYASTKNVKKDNLVSALKAAGIKTETLVERFEEAYALVQKLATPETVVPNI